MGLQDHDDDKEEDNLSSIEKIGVVFLFSFLIGIISLSFLYLLINHYF